MEIVTAEQGLSQNLSWFRGFIQGKTRITLAWVFAIVLGFSAKEYPSLPGVGLCFIGAALRYWASGYLRKDSRPAVGGPYAYVRNPLYLGTYLMALGTAWAVENWILLSVATVLFAWLYHFIILDEEVKLRKIFGEPYLEYSKYVPRFFPRVWIFSGRKAKQDALSRVNPEATHHQFSHELAMKNKAYEAFASFGGLIGFVTLVAFVWKALG
jgi:protein-S-isoprenylcysteine O-methyltransferase Ste14